MLGQKLQNKVNRIYAYVEAMNRVDRILEPLWNEYINEQSMTRKEIIWKKIERFEKIQDNLNDQYHNRS